MKITKTVLLAVAIQYLHVVTGFPTGPPRTDFVCKDMFPVGHGYDAQFTEPPYSIKLSQNVYTPWEELRVTVSASEQHLIRGLFVQARRANCNHPQQKEPVGTFQLLLGERYLQTMPCLDRLNSSISHRSNPGMVQAVFKWYAPAVSVGHIYFVATVVKERKTFWTNVYSEVLRDLSNDGGAQICPARKLLDPLMPQTTTPKQGNSSSLESSSPQGLCSPNVLILICSTIAILATTTVLLFQ